MLVQENKKKEYRHGRIELLAFTEPTLSPSPMNLVVPLFFYIKRYGVGLPLLR